MNREPLARAIAAACITIALLASGMLLARSALGALPQQTLQPDEFLPLIVQPRQSPAASPTATTTATTTATASPTTTTTATTTATASPTTTPTNDPLANAYLQVNNLTGFDLEFILIGPTSGKRVMTANQPPLEFPIQTGSYKITSSTHCNAGFEVPFEFPNPGLTYVISFTCP
jgi:hypothetical protein